MDSRTGDSRYYRVSGFDESAILTTVNSKVSNFSNYHATQPILYNVYGNLTAAVPVISGGIFQKLALVHVGTGQVALGDTKREALTEYRKILREKGNSDVPSNQANTLTVSGLIDRIGPDNQKGDTLYYVVLDGTPDLIFTGSTNISFELPVATVSDLATISYMETGEGVVAMESFDIAQVTPKVTKAQEQADLRQEATQKGESTRLDGRDARAKIDNMTDEELLQLVPADSTVE
jgi:hypothetical protein